MLVDFSINGILWRFANHLDGKFLKSLISNFDERGFKIDSLTPLLITFLIPYTFICFNLLSVTTFQECIRELDLG